MFESCISIYIYIGGGASTDTHAHTHRLWIRFGRHQQQTNRNSIYTTRFVAPPSLLCVFHVYSRCTGTNTLTRIRSFHILVATVELLLSARALRHTYTHSREDFYAVHWHRRNAHRLRWHIHCLLLGAPHMSNRYVSFAPKRRVSRHQTCPHRCTIFHNKIQQFFRLQFFFVLIHFEDLFVHPFVRLLLIEYIDVFHTKIEVKWKVRTPRSTAARFDILIFCLLFG